MYCHPPNSIKALKGKKEPNTYSSAVLMLLVVSQEGHPAYESSSSSSSSMEQQPGSFIHPSVGLIPLTLVQHTGFLF